VLQVVTDFRIQQITETTTVENTPPDYDWSKYESLGFYFENDVPGGPNGTKPGENKEGGASRFPFDTYYNQYIGLKSVYQQKAPQFVNSDGAIFSASGINNFFTEVIEGNFNQIQTELLKQIDEVLIKDRIYYYHNDRFCISTTKGVI
jgi:hypothetical protein